MTNTLAAKVLVFSAIMVELTLAGQIIDLNNNNFTSKVLNADNTVKDGDWFIKMYAADCPHCIELRPTWEAFADEHDDINVAQAACWDDAKDICDLFNIEGVPTLIFLQEGETKYYAFPTGTEKTLTALNDFVDDGWEHAVEMSFV